MIQKSGDGLRAAGGDGVRKGAGLLRACGGLRTRFPGTAGRPPLHTHTSAASGQVSDRNRSRALGLPRRTCVFRKRGRVPSCGRG